MRNPKVPYLLLVRIPEGGGSRRSILLFVYLFYFSFFCVSHSYIDSHNCFLSLGGRREAQSISRKKNRLLPASPPQPNRGLAGYSLMPLANDLSLLGRANRIGGSLKKKRKEEKRAGGSGIESKPTPGMGS